MAKLTKDYFKDDMVLIVGYPLDGDPSMKMILPAFGRNGIRVYALNEQAEGDAEIRLYRSFSELPEVPECAYIYLDRGEITPWIGRMASNGVTRVLFHSKRDVSQADIDACRAAGLETAVACPLMLLGKGLHKLHKLLAGV